MLIIGAGGTGGHLFPALAIGKAVKKINSDSEILFLVTKDSEENIVKKIFKVKIISSATLNLKKPQTILSAFLKLIKGFFSSLNLLLTFRPFAILVTGGYAVFPLALATILLRKKLFLQEPNSIPGKTSLFFQKFAEKIFVAFPQSKNYFKFKEKIILTGNPLREIEPKLENEKLNLLQFKNQKKVLVFGGSQGAEKINNALIFALPLFSEDYFFMHITGKDKYQLVKNKVQEIKNLKAKYEILPFAENILNLMQLVDLVVGRAGAGTCAEITFLGKPAILVPYPYATENHQQENVRILKEKNAVEVILDKDLTPEKLFTAVNSLFNNKEKMQQMSLQAKSLGFSNAAQNIAQEILNYY